MDDRAGTEDSSWPASTVTSSLRQAILTRASASLDAVGIASADDFATSRLALERGRDAGRHGGMAFTYRNPRRSTTPRQSLRHATTVITGALGYLEPTPVRPEFAAGRVSRYAWRDHYRVLRAALDEIAETVREAGHRAVVVVDQNNVVDRAAAHRAGIGWWGKNTNLLIPGAGSWFVIGSVITDASVEPTTSAPVEDGCRTCVRCLEACPTGALSVASADGSSAVGQLDARRCLAWLVQTTGVFPRAYRIALGDRLYGCDDCQDVCPPGRRSVPVASSDDSSDESEGVAVASPTRRPLRSRADEFDGPPDAWVDLVALLAATDEELLDRFGRWYIPDRDPAHLRRNALLVLGNVADPDDPEVRRVVATSAVSDSAIERAHAMWTAARLGFDDLVAQGRTDDHPWVRAESAIAPAVPRRRPAGSPR